MGTGPGDAHLGHRVAAGVQEAPHPLVAVERREVAERRAPDGDRVPPPVVVAAHRQVGAGAPLQEGHDRAGVHAGLVAEHQHQHVAPGSTAPSAAAIDDAQPSA